MAKAIQLEDTLKIVFKKESYHIHWSRTKDSFRKNIRKYVEKQRRSALITNDTIAKLYKKKLQEFFPSSDLIVLKDGERFKRLTVIEDICDKLLEKKHNRSSLLIAFGGGVIGDIVGFSAASFMRGIDFIQIPTTLLSMVDSSVGGKTGVNLSSGKNMVGSFYQPKAVLMHLPLLKTLSKKEFQCGLAEVVKSALLKDISLYKYLKDKSSEIYQQDLDLWHRLSYSSVAVKKWVVQKDEKEKSLRAILNLGHTLAHALESFYQYKTLNHGEAVSIGMSFALFLGYRLKMNTKTDFEDLFDTLGLLELPRSFANIPGRIRPDLKALLQLMKKDKKNTSDAIQFVLISKPGFYRLPQPVADAKIAKTLEEFANVDSYY